MSETLEHLRKKIEGAEKLGGVVRTMKTLAASQLHHYEMAVRALEDYSYSLELGLIATLRSRHESLLKPSNQNNHSTKKALLVFGSDQSLVGQFNEVMADEILKIPFENKDEIQLFVVGERLASRLEDHFRQIKVFHLPHTLAEVTSFVGQLLYECEAFFLETTSGRLDLHYHKPHPTHLYDAYSISLFPLDEHIRTYLGHKKWASSNLPEVLGDNEETWHTLRREYLFMIFFRACSCSLASENASRLAAMQRAEKSIEELLEILSQDHHRLRQEGIDAELFDVLSGVEALVT